MGQWLAAVAAQELVLAAARAVVPVVAVQVATERAAA
jgi:hypothetical protein